MTHLKTAVLAGAALVAIAAASQPAISGVTIFSGLDQGWASAPPVGPNSLTAEEAFVAATGASNPITFAGGSLAAGVTLSGGGEITNAPSQCGFALCGGATDSDGWYEYQYGVSATFNFSTPISYFGAYFSGVQFANTLTFNDGSPELVDIPAGSFSEGGMSFAGFNDPGASITSVTVRDPLQQGLRYHRRR